MSIITVNTSKARGFDRISGRMLKDTANTFVPIITELFNSSLKSGIVPQKWKISSVVPIPKSHNNNENPNNYRSISLLPIISKLLERHVHGIVFDHLEEKDLISRDQWRFTLGRSTTTALISTFHDILQLMESRVDVPLIFFDMRKALI